MAAVSALKIARQHDRNNAIAAQVILDDPERYQGIQLEWAKVWASHHEPQLEFEFVKPEPKVRQSNLPPGARESFARHLQHERTMGYRQGYAAARFKAAYGQWPPREWQR